MDSIALGQPALSLAAKIQSRARRAGIDLEAGDVRTTDVERSVGERSVGERSVGERLWALVVEATESGLDAEAELRRVALAHLARARDIERPS